MCFGFSLRFYLSIGSYNSIFDKCGIRLLRSTAFRFALLSRLIGFFREISAGSTRVVGTVSTDGRMFRFHSFGSIFCRSFISFDCAKRSSSLPSSVPFPIFGRVTPIISDYRRISSHDFRNMTEFPVRRNTTEFVFYVFLLIFFSQHSCCSSPSTESTFTFGQVSQLCFAWRSAPQRVSVLQTLLMRSPAVMFSPHFCSGVHRSPDRIPSLASLPDPVYSTTAQYLDQLPAMSSGYALPTLQIFALPSKYPGFSASPQRDVLSQDV